MPLFILGGEDFNAIRAITMSVLDPDTARTLMPDSTISLASIAGRAEALVMRAVGTDWQDIVAGTAPIGYAQGDPVAAQSLLQDATIMYACAYLCPVLKQVIAVSDKDEVLAITRDLDWTALQCEYMDQARDTMALLLPIAPIPALMGGGMGRAVWP